MRKWRYLLIFFLLELLILCPVSAEEEVISWRSLVQKMQPLVESGSLGEDFSLSFKPFPMPDFEKSMCTFEKGEYTLKGDGTVFVQKGNQKSELKISPNELLWLCKSLLEYNLAGLPEHELVMDVRPYLITLRIGELEKTIPFYVIGGKGVNKEIIWQYLVRFGELLLERAGLRDNTEPILPICKGIIKEEKIDSNNDNLIDWLRVGAGFYSFKAGDFIIDFLGSKQRISFPQGDTDKEFFINAYLLRKSKEKEDLVIADAIENEGWVGYLTINYDTEKPSAEYGMKMILNDPDNYKKENLRNTPDLVFKNKGKWRFKVNLGQAVVLEIKSVSPKYETSWWFNVNEISPKEVKLGGGLDWVLRAGEENENLAFSGILWNTLRLLETDTNSAIFEVGWRVSYSEEMLTEEKKATEEMVHSGRYKGTEKESGLKEHLKHLEEIESTRKSLDLSGLEIIINYSAPPVEKLIEPQVTTGGRGNYGKCWQSA